MQHYLPFIFWKSKCGKKSSFKIRFSPSCLLEFSPGDTAIREAHMIWKMKSFYLVLVFVIPHFTITLQDELYLPWKAKEVESIAWDIFESLTEGKIATLSDMEKSIRLLPYSGQQRFFIQLALLYSLVDMPPTYTKINKNLKQGRWMGMFLNHDCCLWWHCQFQIWWPCWLGSSLQKAMDLIKKRASLKLWIGK